MSKVTTKALTKEIESSRSAVEIRLDMDMKSFKKIEAQFVADLAEALEIDVEDIRKIRMLVGCVRYILDLPETAVKKLKEAKKSKSVSVKLGEVFDSYKADPRNIKLNVVEDAPYIKRMLGVADELQKDGRLLTWLHLSDVHFQNKPGAMRWNQDKVKDSFITSLPKLLADWDLSPDMLFFTGDLAFSGLAPQYDLAADFMNQVSSTLVKKVRTYVVPGNHDVNWDKIDGFNGELRELLTSQYEVSSFLLNNENKAKRKKIFSKFHSFSAFLNQHFKQYGPPSYKGDYFYVDRFEHSGVSVGVAGLNSAWISAKKHVGSYDFDLDQLILGEPQVDLSIKHLESSQIKFALLHHPPESMWFRDHDRRMQAAFLPKFDFVLRGHEHEPIMRADTNILTDEQYVHIASGALYDATELKGRTGYPIGFNVVRLNLDTGKGIIFYWRYVPNQYKWARDIIADDGMKVFDIPEKVTRRIEALQAGTNSANNQPFLPQPGIGKTIKKNPNMS